MHACRDCMDPVDRADSELCDWCLGYRTGHPSGVTALLLLLLGLLLWWAA